MKSLLKNISIDLKKSEIEMNNYMCDLIPIPNEFDDANDFWQHPIYDRYEANRLGLVRHVKHKQDIGRLGSVGYLKITVYDQGVKKKL